LPIIAIGSPAAIIPLENFVTVPVEVVNVGGTEQLNWSVNVNPSHDVFLFYLPIASLNSTESTSAYKES